MEIGLNERKKKRRFKNSQEARRQKVKGWRKKD